MLLNIIGNDNFYFAHSFLGELAEGSYELHVQLQTLLGHPLTASEKTTFQIGARNDWREAPGSSRPHTLRASSLRPHTLVA